MSETKTIPVLWFTATGAGPNEFKFKLRDFPSEVGEPSALGMQVKAAGLVIGDAGALIDGGFYFHREQIAELHRQLGAWLDADTGPAEPVKERR